MKAIDGFTPTQSTGDREQLPAGNYVGKIIGAKTEEGKFCEQLTIQLEITEGQYAGFFKKDFDAQAGGKFGQKYKGVLRLNVPVGDGSDFDKYRLDALQRAAGAIEASNEGYRWDWDEKKLKGKAVGIRVRQHTKTFDDGREATWSEVYALCGVEGIEKLKTPKPKVDAPKEGTGMSNSGLTPAEDDELPF